MLDKMNINSKPLASVRNVRKLDGNLCKNGGRYLFQAIVVSTLGDILNAAGTHVFPESNTGLATIAHLSEGHNCRQLSLVVFRLGLLGF